MTFAKDEKRKRNPIQSNTLIIFPSFFYFQLTSEDKFYLCVNIVCVIGN